MSVVATDSEGLRESSIRLQTLFISALNETSNDSWSDVLRFLTLLPDHELKSLLSLPETIHYIIRSIHLLKSLSTPHEGTHTTLPASSIRERLQALLSTLVTDLKDCDSSNIVVSPRVKDVTKQHQQRKAGKSSKSQSLTVPSELLTYTASSNPVTYIADKMTFKDIVDSSDCVIEERKQMELLHLHPSKMATSLQVGFTTSKTESQVVKPILRPILDSDIEAPVKDRDSPKMFKQVELDPAHNKVIRCKMSMGNEDCQPFKLKTGVDVVRAFAFGTIPSSTQEVYLNFGVSVPWDPYYLTVVPKIRKDPTHTIATKFGFLHIEPNGESEHQSFSNWCRDSALFRIVREIPIFRYYLQRKMIKSWHRNVRTRKFTLVQKQVYHELLRFHQPFMLTLWMINNFCQDLLSLEIHMLTSLAMYSEQTYSENVRKSERSLVKFLRRFWDYSDRVLSNVMLETESKVLELETKKSHMPFVSDIPISIQKRNHLQLEEDLTDALQRRKQLTKLFQSCHYLVKANMNLVVQRGVAQWLGVVLGPNDDNDDDEDSEWAGISRNSMMSSTYTTTDQSDEGSRNRTVPCLLETELNLNHTGHVICTLSIDQLSCMLIEPLRIVEKCLFISNCSPVSSTASTPGGGGYNNDYRTQPRANTSSSTPKLLDPSLIAEVQNNCFVLEAESKLTKVLSKVSREVDDYLKSCSWIESLNTFLIEWQSSNDTTDGDDGMIAESMNPRKIESALMSGYIWLDKLSSLPHYFTTSYCLLSISTETLVSDLSPRLESVMNTLQNNCIHTIHSLCVKIMEMIQRHLEILSCKRYDLEGFAYYTQQLRIMREERQGEHDNLTRSSTLLSSLLSSGVSVPSEVKKSMLEVERLWVECEMKIKEMEEFVESQTPLKAQGLQENIENCEQEVLNLVASLSKDPYTDPNADPSIITANLQKIHGDALSIQSRLVDLIKWRLAITGHSHNMAIVTSAIHNLECRKALWQHMLNFNVVQNEWLRIPFKKLNIDDMQRKLHDLLQSLNHLHHYLPPNDPVLEALRRKEGDYNDLIPLLKQLSSPAVKASHWHTLLAAVEEEYHSSHEYTLQDFMLYKLFDSTHSELIVEVCQSAERESKLKHSLSNLRERWEKMMLTIHKKSSSRFMFAIPKTTLATEKATKFALSPSHKPPLSANDDNGHLIVVGNSKNILLLLEEDLTELQILRGVAQADSVKNQIEHWYMRLIQLQEIVELLDTSQDRWWDILNLYCELGPQYHQSTTKLSDLQSCSIKFQDITNGIHQDPFVLSLLERRRGQKGFRDLQGDALQQCLMTVHSILDNILSSLKDIIHDIATSFPRLLLLSDWEILHINNHRGNPCTALQSIRQMFPAITNINTIEIDKSSNSASDDSTPEGSSRGDSGYQIVSVEGSQSEWLGFCTPLPIGHRKGSEWLLGLERAIKYSLSCHVTACLGSIPRQIIGSASLEEEDFTILLWLAENVSQAVILAVECSIGQLIRTCFEESDTDFKYNIEKALLNIERAVSYCSQLIKSVGVSPLLSQSQSTVVIKTLKNIVLILNHKHHVMSSIVTNQLQDQQIPNMDVMVTCVLYHGHSEATPTIGYHGSQATPSLNTSLSSISTAIPAISRIQQSDIISRGSTPRTSVMATPPHRSVKSIVANVPATPTQCHVQYGSLWQRYGFEYMGVGGMRMVMTPPTERCYYQLMKGLVSEGGIYHIQQQQQDDGLKMAEDIAMVLGRPMLSISCVTMTTVEALRSIVMSSLQIGCILVLSEFSCLDERTKIKFNGLLNDVKETMDSAGLLIPNDTPKTIDTTQSSSDHTGLYRPSVIPSSHSLSSTSSVHTRLLLPEESSIASRSNISKSMETRIDWYNDLLYESLLSKGAEVDIGNAKITAQSQYSCMVCTNGEKTKKDGFHEVGPVPIDVKMAVEGYLLSNGFSKASELSTALVSCLEELQEEELNILQYPLLTVCKGIIETSQEYLFDELRANNSSSDKRDLEAYCLSRGLVHYTNVHCIQHDDSRVAGGVLDMVLKWFKVPSDSMEVKNTPTLLVNAIKRQLDDVHLQKNEKILDKIVQLHYGLLDTKCAILTGPCGSGKTTVYQTLVKAYNSFITDSLMKGQVRLHVVNPGAYTVDEFIGCYSSPDDSQSTWTPGIFPKLLESISNIEHTKCFVADNVKTPTIVHWIVLDGPLSGIVLEMITKLIDNSQLEVLPNGETLSLPDNCRILIESSTSTGDILTPSILPHCTIVHCQSLFSYHDVINTWLKRSSTVHNLSIAGIDVLSSLMHSVLPNLITFVCNSSTGNDYMNHINASSIDSKVFLVEKFLHLLSSVLERNSPKESDTPSHQTAASTRVSSSRVSRLSSAYSLSTVHGSISTHSVSNTDHAHPDHAHQSLDDPSMNDLIPEDGEDDLSDEGSDIDAHIARNQQYHTAAIFMFTVIWSFGAYISNSYCSEFSSLVRDLATQNPPCCNMIPPTGQVFDYYLDLKTYCFTHWNEKKKERTSSNTHYISVPELERFRYICDLYWSYGINVILIGAPGNGKTSFLKNMIQPRTNSIIYTVSHTLATPTLQSSIIDRLARLRRRQVGSKSYGSGSAHRNSFILDDLHLASPIDSSSGSLSMYPYTSVHELVSMIAEHKTLPDPCRRYVHSLKDIQLFASSTDVGTKRLSLKLLRRFNPVQLFALSDYSLDSIVQKRLSSWINRFGLEEKNEFMCKALSVALVTAHGNLSSRFHPSPTNPHFIFSLHDLSAVWDGLLLMSSKHQPTTGGPAGITGRRQHREGQSKDHSKRKVSGHRGRSSGRLSTSGISMSGVSRRSMQTGRGLKILPSLTENQRVQRQSVTDNDRVVPSGRPTRQSLPGILGNQQQQQQQGSSQQAILSTSLPIELKGGAGTRVSVSVSDKEEMVRVMKTIRGLCRLYCHEVTRVYGDRLTDSKDKIWLVKLIEMCCKYSFCGIDIEDGSSAGPAPGSQVGMTRRVRPGRLSKGGGRNDNQPVTIATVKIQSSTLVSDGLLYQSMVELLPRDRKVELLKYDELVMKGEDLCALMYAKLPMADSSAPSSVGEYSEIGDGQVKDAVNTVLEVERRGDAHSELSHVIMNKEAMEHVIRVCRALVIPHTHCLLLGPKAVGKKTVTKLAAKILNAVMFEINHDTMHRYRSVLRDACLSAGADKKRTVLLVEATASAGEEGVHHSVCWKYILDIMREGLVSDLFTASEILILSKKINTDKLRHTTESAIQGFTDNIRLHLRVVISWDTPPIDAFPLITYHDVPPDPKDTRFINEEYKQNLFHSVFHACSYIDKLNPWSTESYSEVALQYWNTRGITKVSHITSSDLEALGYLAAHIHLTAVSTIHSVLPGRVRELVGTPGEFIQCLRNGFVNLEYLKEQGQDKVQSLHSSLSHLYDIEREVSNQEYKLDSELIPELRRAEDEVDHHKKIIMAAKERYMTSHERCKNAEDTIDKETSEVTKLKEVVDVKFGEVAPSYYSSLETLSSLERSVITEVMGYRVPSTHLFPVFEGLCMLFDRPPTWEDCHQLMISPHFYESLKFFDKDNVSQSKLNKLEKLLANQKKICLPRIALISKAIVPVVLWIAALVEYRKAKMAVQPYHDQLAKAESILTNANKVYVEMRHDMMETKEALEKEHSKHKEIMKRLKTAKANVQVVETRVNSLKRLLSSLSIQKTLWERRLTDTQAHLDCLPAESLLIAAVQTYCNILPSNVHLSLWNNWIGYCKGLVPLGSLNSTGSGVRNTKIRLENDLTLKTILADDNELIGLKRREIFSDEASLQKALLWRLYRKHCNMFIQLVYDPDGIAFRYIRGLYAGEEDALTVDRFICITTTQPNAFKKLSKSVKNGYKTILRVPLPIHTESMCASLHSIISWANGGSSDNTVLVDGESIEPHPNLQLFIVLPFRINALHSFNAYILRTCASGQLCNMELSPDGVSSIIHRFVVEESRRELSIQKWALLADLKLHKNSMMESEVAIMSLISQIDKSQLHTNDSFEPIIQSVDEVEVTRTEAMEQVNDTERGLKDISDRMYPYQQLSQYFTGVYLCYRKLTRVCPQVNITITSLQSMLSDILTQRDNTKFFLSQSSLPPFLLHLEHTLTLSIHRGMSPSLYPHQRVLFPLLLALTSFDDVNDDVWRLLKYPQTVSVLETLTIPNTQSILPQYIKLRRMICEETKSLKELTKSIDTDSHEWIDYFKDTSSLLFPVPGRIQQLSLMEKLTIWKIFQPEKFSDAVRSFISLTMGPEYLPPSPDPSLSSPDPSLPSIPSSTHVILCLYNQQHCINNSTDIMETVNTLFGLTSNTVTVVSALDEEFINQVSTLLDKECNVMIEHLILSEDRVSQVTSIFKTVTKCHPQFRLYLPIPDTLLLQLRDHLHPWTYHTIAIPPTGNTGQQANESLIQDFHGLYTVLDYSTPENLTHMKNMVKEMGQESSLLLNSDLLQSEVVSNDLKLLSRYLDGHDSYTSIIGYLLTCITGNTIPHHWNIQQHTSAERFDDLLNH